MVNVIFLPMTGPELFTGSPMSSGVFHWLAIADLSAGRLKRTYFPMRSVVRAGRVATDRASPLGKTKAAACSATIKASVEAVLLSRITVARLAGNHRLTVW